MRKANNSSNCQSSGFGIPYGRGKSFLQLLILYATFLILLLLTL